MKKTIVKYNELKQEELKELTAYKVNDTLKEYAKYISDNDWAVFMLQLLTINRTKSGDLFKDYEKGLGIKGASLEYYKRSNGTKRPQWNLKSREGSRYGFYCYIKYSEEYGGRIVLTFNEYNSEGYTYCTTHEKTLYLNLDHQPNEQELEGIVQKEIASLQNHSQHYLRVLREIPRQAKKLDKLLHENTLLYNATLKEWF